MNSRRKRNPVIGAVLGATLVLVLVALIVTTCGGSGGASGIATDFSGKTLQGEKVSLSEYRGRPVVLAFMASW